MAPLAIVFGLGLVILGGVLYGMADPERQSLTAFIPSGFGLALVISGLIAMNEKARKHAMHVSALIGLVGFLIPSILVARKVMSDDPNNDQWGLATIGQAVMAVLSLVYLALCVKSFVDARRRQAQQGAGSPTV
jgi:peptidoglycan/LPS O-acetylase OafA/YrhL